MKTLNDLKIIPECWEFIIDKTETWEFVNGQTEPMYCISKISGMAFYLNNINSESLESVIYQAIDGINSEYNYCIQQGAGFVQAFKHGESENGVVFDSPKDDRTIARLKLLQWIWQREKKEK
jgi:hypothetical protein